jgi:hypothetical protein
MRPSDGILLPRALGSISASPNRTSTTGLSRAVKQYLLWIN